MATKPSSGKKNTKNKNTQVKRRVVKSRSRILFGNRTFTLVAAILFGATGLYLLVQSGALQPEEVMLRDEPARGLIYDGKKVKNKGPCKGGFDITTEEDVKKDGKEKRRCSHLDPGPPGVDIRERIKHVDANLRALAAHDAKHPPAEGDEMSDYEQTPLEAPEAIWAGSMNGIGAVRWPCFGTGVNGPRIQAVYVYHAGGTNRLPDLRPGFAAIAKRTNGIFFYSGKESGNAHQVRFATHGGNKGCAIRIAAVPMTWANMDTIGEIRARLIDAGFKHPDRKYMIWVDRNVSGKCGQGEIRADSSPGQTNANNTSTTYAVTWKSCWNYAEPHELMHMLGGVQPNAPYATAGYHCRDERDVMCYKDASNVTIVNRCTRAIDWWRFDCKHNTYYRGNSPTSGYLSNHWNTANNRFLTR